MGWWGRAGQKIPPFLSCKKANGARFLTICLLLLVDFPETITLPELAGYAHIVVALMLLVRYMKLSSSATCN